MRRSLIGSVDRIVYALGTGFYIGCIPPRLGTLGALLGLPLAFVLHPLLPRWGYLALILGLCALGIYICGRTAELIGAKDPAEVVYDEYVTVPLVFVLMPTLTPAVIVLGFLLHRVWDIAKPLGIRRLQDLPGGFGIMLDDVVAGFAAGACLYLLAATGALGAFGEM